MEKGYQLIICEKPSACKRVADSLGNPKTLRNGKISYFELDRGGKKIVVVPAVGHLLTLAPKTKSWSYPIFDVEWVPSWEVNKTAAFSKPYIENIRKIAKGASEFISATDFDIEGELISYNILKFVCGVEDAKRMKFSTLTKDELVDSYEKIRPHIEHGLVQAGITRHTLDFYFGVNISKALTHAIYSALNKRKILSSGRVQGPCLKILADRELEIQKFVPVPFWEIYFTGLVKEHEILFKHATDKFWKKEDAENIYAKCKGKDAIVTEVKKRQYKQDPPTPFDLTTLQIDAYRLLGYTPQKTQQLAQEIYSMALISYPRTSSQKLPQSLGLKKILEKLSTQKQFSEIAKKVLKNKNLIPKEGDKDDPAHPAIYPTGDVPSNLNTYQSKLYSLIVHRFIAVFGEPALRESIEITAEIEKEKFLTRGRRTIKKGWIELYGPFARFDETTLPEVEEGLKIPVKKLEMLDKKTEPPSRYTGASIIKELERQGLGTKSTRAAIVQILYNRNYIIGKSIQVTKLGLTVIEALKKYCSSLLSEELTRDFEKDMDLIEKGKTKSKDVVEKAKKFLEKLFADFKKNEFSIGESLKEGLVETEEEESKLGKCMKCGGTLRVMYSPRTKNHFVGCSGYPNCRNIYPLPRNSKAVATEKMCPLCNTPIIKVIRSGKRPFEMCIDPTCKSKENWGKKEYKPKKRDNSTSSDDKTN